MLTNLLVSLAIIAGVGAAVRRDAAVSTPQYVPCGHAFAARYSRTAADSAQVWELCRMAGLDSSVARADSLNRSRR